MESPLSHQGMSIKCQGSKNKLNTFKKRTTVISVSNNFYGSHSVKH